MIFFLSKRHHDSGPRSARHVFLSPVLFSAYSISPKNVRLDASSSIAFEIVATLQSSIRLSGAKWSIFRVHNA
jgi:hypothetical protein